MIRKKRMLCGEWVGYAFYNIRNIGGKYSNVPCCDFSENVAHILEKLIILIYQRKGEKEYFLLIENYTKGCKKYQIIVSGI